MGQRRTMPLNFCCDLIGQIEDYDRSREKLEKKDFKDSIAHKTIKKLSFKYLLPRPRPKDCFAVSKNVMLEREKNVDGKIDIRLKVSYEKRPNSIAQVLVPIEIYKMVEENSNQKQAVKSLLLKIQDSLIKSYGDGGVYEISEG